MEAAFHELDALEAELETAASAMHSGTPESIHHHAELLEHYARRGGFERRARKDAVTLAFGFRGREHDATARLSGGERTRLGLAALLVENPDVLLLDEPTNHLDIVMVEWLEGFLSRYPGAALIISHDRAFLDAATNETAHLWRGEVKVYPGNYTTFRAALDEDIERQRQQAAQDARKIAALTVSTERMKIWGLGMSKLARRASSMETRLERLKKGAAAPPPKAERTARILFHAPESGDIVLDAAHLTKRLAGRTFFEDVQVQIRRGERVALIGRNGAGKTTLLRMLLGLIPAMILGATPAPGRGSRWATTTSSCAEWTRAAPCIWRPASTSKKTPRPMTCSAPTCFPTSATTRPSRCFRAASGRGWRSSNWPRKTTIFWSWTSRPTTSIWRC